MDNRGPTMIEGKFDFGFAVDWMRKDLGIALDEARRNGARLPVTALVDQFYADLQAAGRQPRRHLEPDQAAPALGAWPRGPPGAQRGCACAGALRSAPRLSGARPASSRFAEDLEHLARPSDTPLTPRATSAGARRPRAR